jgi:predicted MPP superfamily phosphohydrolase
MLLLFLLVVLGDIVRLANHFTGFLPALFYTGAFKLKLFAGVLIFVFVSILAGHINALVPKIRKLAITTEKSAGSMTELRIAMASDIHMGTVIGPRRMTRLVNQINALKPDLILFAGDVVDEDLAPVIRHDLGSVLLQLKAPLGVYAITGNHEYIGGVEKAVAYLQKHGITMLRDSAVTINQSFVLAGREDRSKSNRKSISDILSSADRTLPVILMDHQPFDLDSVAMEKVDIQFSGHTHHGQMWPLNYITEAIYEVSRGYLKKGNSHFYVSNGFGTWGPPVRIGNRPEIVEVIVKFNQP